MNPLTRAVRYLGLSYSSLDCWGLVRLVYREELGIELPFDPLQARSQMVEVDSPEPFDVALLRSRSGRHVAIVIDRNRLLHSCEGKNVCIERLDSRCVVGYYRHPGARDTSRAL